LDTYFKISDQRKKDIIANEKQALIALHDQLVISGMASLPQIQLVLDQETVHFADQSDRVLGLWNALNSVWLRLQDRTANPQMIWHARLQSANWMR
jgi:hypothetical protein